MKLYGFVWAVGHGKQMTKLIKTAANGSSLSLVPGPNKGQRNLIKFNVIQVVKSL